MENTAYMWGFIGGLFAFVIISMLLMSVLRKLAGRKTANYDERQELARGSAYRAAFYCLLLWSFLYGLCDLLGLPQWCDLWTGQFIGSIFSVTVFACLCIERDAYFRVGDRPRFYLSLWGSVAVLNLILIVINVADAGFGYYFSGGILNFHSVNLFVEAMLLVVLLTTLLRLRRGEQMDEEEAE